MLPELMPIRIGMPFEAAFPATARTSAGLRMLPGLMRSFETPASTAAIARSCRKWMSATSGTQLSATIERRAEAEASSGTETLTIWAPALASDPICAMVARASEVGVFVMDWTDTGAPPPIVTPPTVTACDLLLRILMSSSRQPSAACRKGRPPA